MRGVTAPLSGSMGIAIISTHTPRERRDAIAPINDFEKIKFQLTRLVRGVTRRRCRRRGNILQFQLTRLVRGVTKLRLTLPLFAIISTHTPRERRDTRRERKRQRKNQFQLTRLVRGVTAPSARCKTALTFQLTRLVRGVTYLRG